jgi:hypothetical protein
MKDRTTGEIPKAPEDLASLAIRRQARQERPLW